MIKPNSLFSVTKEEKPYLILIITLSVVVFLCRLYNLGYLTLWVDEFVHANRAKYISETGLLTGDENGILYTICVLPFFKLFGATEFWARFPSAVFGTLTIPVAFIFCKNYFNKRIGVIVSLLLATSLFINFWSRIGRMYAIYLFFFLLLVHVTAKLCNIKGAFKKSSSPFWNYLQFTPSSLMIFIGAFILALLSHMLSVFILYAIVFYHFLLFVKLAYKNPRDKGSYTNIHAVLGYVFVLLLSLSVVPVLQDLIKPLLVLLVPEHILGYLIPDLKYLASLPTFDTFDLYFNVLKTDFPYLYWFAWIGFGLAIWKYKNSGLYLFAIGVLLFMMMSFLFRGITLPRYILYLHPFFCIAIAVSLDELYLRINKLIDKKNPTNKKLFIGALVLLLFFTPIKASYKMITEEKHGNIIPRELSVWHFVKWKKPLKKLNKELQPDDIILSTMVHYNKFYIGEYGMLFRQNRYNPDLKKYEALPIDTLTDNAHSLEAVQKLIQQNPRGWLLADYYFHNVMTDPKTRDFIIKNTTFRYDMSNDDVKVFQWDKSAPNQTQNAILEYLTPNAPASYPYNISVSAKNQHIISVEAEGVKKDGELLVVVNNQPFAVSRSNGSLYQQNKSSTTRQWFQFQVSGAIFKPNQANNIQFATSTKPTDELQTRIAVYNLYVN